MDLPAAGLAGDHFLEETDKLLAGMARRGFDQGFAGGSIRQNSWNLNMHRILMVLAVTTFIPTSVNASWFCPSNSGNSIVDGVGYDNAYLSA